MPSQMKKHSGNGATRKTDTSKMAESSHGKKHASSSLSPWLAFGAGVGVGVLLTLALYEQRPSRADLERFGEEAWDMLSKLKDGINTRLHS